MATGSGLDAQIGFAEETTVGTAVTVTTFTEFDSETLQYDPTFLEPTGLRPGRYAKRGARVRTARKSVSGGVTMEVATLGQSLLWKHAVGSTTTATVTGTNAHAFGGTFVGKALTVQVGRPLPSGTVTPFTYAGCKVASWEFSCQDNAVPTLALEFDGMTSTTATALATASYPTGSSVYTFADAVLSLGGSPVSGVVIKGITIKGENPRATERFGLGNAGVKSEQLLNGNPTITGTLDAEFDKTTLYDAFAADTLQAFSLVLTKGSASLTFAIPQIKFKTSAPQVGGPDIVQASVEFEGYDDETNPFYTVTVVGA